MIQAIIDVISLFRTFWNNGLQVSMARRLVEINPSKAEYHHFLGCLYGFQGDYISSQLNIENALKIEFNPDWLYDKASSMRLLEGHDPLELISVYQVSVMTLIYLPSCSLKRKLQCIVKLNCGWAFILGWCLIALIALNMKCYSYSLNFNFALSCSNERLISFWTRWREWKIARYCLHDGIT